MKSERVELSRKKIEASRIRNRLIISILLLFVVVVAVLIILSL